MMKNQRACAGFLCALIILVSLFSAFVIHDGEDHECTGINCEICAIIHHVQRAEELDVSLSVFIGGIYLPTYSFPLIAVCSFLIYFCLSLVIRKVQLNN